MEISIARADIQPRPIICCFEIEDPNWRWFEGPMADTGARFEIKRAVPRNALERRLYEFIRYRKWLRIPNLPRPRACFEAVRSAKTENAQVIVTSGPLLAAWCGLFARLLHVDVPIVGHYFNLDSFPGFAKRWCLSWMLSRVDRFVILSTFERDVYSRLLRLPEDRFDVVLWGTTPPIVDSPNLPLEKGEYLCAIGGNGRDYATLVEAARRLPQIRFVLVVRPDSLHGLELPANVKVYVELRQGQTMNILMHSRFMVLPLLDGRTPYGHITMVSAMHLGKAFIATDSAGVSDYLDGGRNALNVPPNSPRELAAVIEHLWNDPLQCRRLGENGKGFARTRCTEEQMVLHFKSLLSTLSNRGSLQRGVAP